jgi:hypothetical protein
VLTGRRLALGRALTEEACAALEPGTEGRRAHLERALAARRRALAIARASTLLASVREDDARAVLAELFALDRTAGWEEVAVDIRNAAIVDALGAEVIRRRGDARSARELASRAVAADTGAAPDPVAALALAEADLGSFAEARRLAARLVALEVDGPPAIDAFHSGRVMEYVVSRESASPEHR